jgi:hypothetical protein
VHSSSQMDEHTWHAQISCLGARFFVTIGSAFSKAGCFRL